LGFWIKIKNQINLGSTQKANSSRFYLNKFR